MLCVVCCSLFVGGCSLLVVRGLLCGVRYEMLVACFGGVCCVLLIVCYVEFVGCWLWVWVRCLTCVVCSSLFVV